MDEHDFQEMDMDNVDRIFSENDEEEFYGYCLVCGHELDENEFCTNCLNEGLMG